MNINYCIDCKKQISIYSKRCKSCSNKFRRGKYFVSERGKINLSNAKKGKKHPMYGKHKKEETKRKISEANMGEKNGMWKGDEVGFNCLHKWIKRHKPKPKFCKRCKINPPRDLANISGEYKRDINDFEWLCRKCHMDVDGRLNNLLELNNKIKLSNEEKKRRKREYYKKYKNGILKKKKEYYLRKKLKNES